MFRKMKTIVEEASGAALGARLEIITPIPITAPPSCRKLAKPQLYRVEGTAPKYRNDAYLGGQFANVRMHWFMERNRMMSINYPEILGRDDYNVSEIEAVNELFLLGEAALWKEWMDSVYPEENTELIPVEYPMDRPVPYGTLPIIHGVSGPFYCHDLRWIYDLDVRYWVDVTDCPKIDDAKTAK